jgi:hypothetical protein
METLMLTLMRHSGTAAAQGTLARMSDLCADLAAGARQLPQGSQLATFWQLAAAVLEAQAGGLLVSDVYTKRLSSRLLAQLRHDHARPARPVRSSCAGPALFLQPCGRAHRRAQGASPGGGAQDLAPG